MRAARSIASRPSSAARLSAGSTCRSANDRNSRWGGDDARSRSVRARRADGRPETVFEHAGLSMLRGPIRSAWLAVQPRRPACPACNFPSHAKESCSSARLSARSTTTFLRIRRKAVIPAARSLETSGSPSCQTRSDAETEHALFERHANVPGGLAAHDHGVRLTPLLTVPHGPTGSSSSTKAVSGRSAPTSAYDGRRSLCPLYRLHPAHTSASAQRDQQRGPYVSRAATVPGSSRGPAPSWCATAAPRSGRDRGAGRRGSRRAPPAPRRSPCRRAEAPGRGASRRRCVCPPSLWRTREERPGL